MDAPLQISDTGVRQQPNGENARIHSRHWRRAQKPALSSRGAGLAHRMHCRTQTDRKHHGAS